MDALATGGHALFNHSGRALSIDNSLVPLRCVRHQFTPARQPHIAIFMADDLGFLDTSYAGSTVVRTPHLDVLAEHGTVLSQFRAPTWCAPSRAAFLTGRHGWEVGMASAFGWTAFGRDSMLLPSLLKELGYRTAVVGKLHLNPRTCRHFGTGGAFGCGFDHQYGFLGGMSDYYEHHQTWSRDGARAAQIGFYTIGPEAGFSMPAPALSASSCSGDIFRFVHYAAHHATLE